MRASLFAFLCLIGGLLIGGPVFADVVNDPKEVASVATVDAVDEMPVDVLASVEQLTDGDDVVVTAAAPEILKEVAESARVALSSPNEPLQPDPDDVAFLPATGLLAAFADDVLPSNRGVLVRAGVMDGQSPGRFSTDDHRRVTIARGGTLAD